MENSQSRKDTTGTGYEAHCSDPRDDVPRGQWRDAYLIVSRHTALPFSSTAGHLWSSPVTLLDTTVTR
ncbi:hypothetical protein NPIL_650001 [Nephila pilipes]|uniref:Uncharacterized protein n=1 Tax=Nephila pilipes TaxID=299642 RepID=A0A8X6P2H7_NEPPI|nr:hypothetical protein NPIL_650001 [Nephila pilipes]